MNKILSKAAIAASIAALAIAGGCGEESFKIKGELTGSDNDKVLLEKADYAGYWTIVDSTRTDSKGEFEFSQPRQSGPEYSVCRSAINTSTSPSTPQKP